MVTLLLLLLLPFASAKSRPGIERLGRSSPAAASSPSYTEMWFQEDLDHINRDPGSINIRVLHLNSNTATSAGPLIVYTGNEGPIDQFFNMSGFITTQLPSAIPGSDIYFIEHRYYGKSIPKPFTWAYLNTEQVLFDYADIIMQLRPSNSTPVIVMGGSYGGMLAAWMRMKYTHIVDGAIASSAPVFMGLDNGGGYFANVTGVLEHYGCANYVQQTFYYLSLIGSQSEYWTQLASIFQSCDDFTSADDITALNEWIINAFAGVVQSNYPGASNVDTPLPSWPANATCQYYTNYAKQTNQNPWEWIYTMAQSMQVYYNTSGTSQCFDILGSSRFTPNSWAYQTCTELWCPQGTTNVTDVFPPYPWNPDAQTAYCEATFGVYPRTDWIPINYGMTPANSQVLKYVSNILFVNGALDPWNYGCVTSTTNPNLQVTTMPNGAHHTDLRAPTPQDTSDILNARISEINAIKQWVNAKAAKPDLITS